MKGILYISLLFAFTNFGLHPSKKDRLKLYNDALSQLIDENYYQHCIDFDGRAKNVYDDFVGGKIDSNTYSRTVDSLKIARKGTPPRCVLDYSNVFQIFTKDHRLGTDAILSIREGLKDDFVTEHFSNASTGVIIDTLSQPAQLDAPDLSVSYLEIVPYAKRAHKPYGNGMGVIGFSKIYFNKKSDRAILFYEFNCGPKCGSGEIIFLVKKGDNWTIVKSKRTWVS